jgi:hypothetical protein
MRQIPLTKGQVALVDDSDYEMLSKYKWQVLKRGRTYYATYSEKAKQQITELTLERNGLMLASAAQNNQIEELQRKLLESENEALLLMSKQSEEQESQISDLTTKNEQLRGGITALRIQYDSVVNLNDTVNASLQTENERLKKETVRLEDLRLDDKIETDKQIAGQQALIEQLAGVLQKADYLWKSTALQGQIDAVLVAVSAQKNTFTGEGGTFKKEE